MNLTAIALMAGIGLFFVGLGVYQLATKTLITGGRYRRTRTPVPKPLLYLFSALEIFAGLAAFANIGSTVLRGASLAGSCDERKAQLACTEFHGSGWDVASMSQACPGAALGHAACADDNLLGDGVWVLTQQGQGAECKKRGGSWKPFP